MDNIGIKGILYAAHHKADRIGANLDQIARAVVGHVFVRLDDGADPSAGILAHVGPVIEHTGNRTDADPCKFCDILDGHAPAPPATAPETFPVTFPIFNYSIVSAKGKVK